MGLTKAEIEGANDLVIDCLDVPEWDIKSINGSTTVVTKKGEVFIRVMSGIDRDTIEREWLLNEKKFGEGVPIPHLRVRFAALCLCDEKGKRLFSDNEVVKLGERSSAALERIFDACQKLNGMTAEAVEELGKNSEGGPSD